MIALAARPATFDDAAAIAAIYNEGIEDRLATFETRERTAEDVRGWFDRLHPIVVVTEGDLVVAWSATASYRSRDCYAGVAECSVYVARSARGRGAGRLALKTLIDAARSAGFWKLVSRIFPENHPSRALVKSAGFREVGTYRNHAQLDGQWRDVVIVEYLIRENIGGH